MSHPFVCDNCSLPIPPKRTHLQIHVRVGLDDAGSEIDAAPKHFCNIVCLAIWADLQRAEREAVR